MKVEIAFNSNNTAGNLIVAEAFWDNQAANISSITDSEGNIYATAVGPVAWGGTAGYLQLFYAKNIAGGPNTVTAKLTGNSTNTFEFYTHEYSGADTVSPLDATSVGTGASGTAMNSGTSTTHFANELIFGHGEAGAVATPGQGFTARSTFNSNMTEDKQVTSAGPYNATETGNASQVWAMVMATFKPAFSTTEVLMASSTPAIATGRIKFRLSVGSQQQAGVYSNTIVYIMVPTY